MSLARDAGIGGRTAQLPTAGLRIGPWFSVALVAVCALPVLLFLPFLAEPFSRDEAFYAVAARDTLNGAIPYQDFLDNKPPLIFAWYGLSFLLFGETTWAPRLLVALMASAATFCVYLNGRLLFTRNQGLIAAAAFALSIGLAQFETNANAEYFMLLPMTAGLLAFNLADRTGSDAWYLLAGFAGGATILTKTIYAIPMAFLLFLAVHRRREGLPGWQQLLAWATWRGPLYMVAGSLLSLALVSLPLLVEGAFFDMVNALTYYSAIYSGHASLLMRLGFAVKSPMYLLLLAGPWLVLAMIGAWALLRGEGRRDGVLLFGWFAANMVSIFAVGRYYDHYYAVMLAPMALLIPAGVDLVARNARRIPGQAFIAIGIPLLLMTPLVQTLQIYMRSTPESRQAAKFDATGTVLWEHQADDLGLWLKERTSEDDRIWNFGFQPGIYFAAERQSPTRFYFDHAFGLYEEYEREAINELEAKPPLYIVDSSVYEEANPLNYYSQPVADWIKDNYDYLGKMYFADVYRLRGDDGS